MRRKTYIIAFLTVSSVIFGLTAVSFAQEEKPEDLMQKSPGQGQQKRRLTKEELLKLKQENPEKFNELVARRREQVRQRLEQLKQSDPQKYQEVMERIKQRRRQRLEKLRKENPEKFKEFLSNHPQARESIEDPGQVSKQAQ